MEDIWKIRDGRALVKVPVLRFHGRVNMWRLLGG